MHWKCLAAEIKTDCPLKVPYLLSHIRVRMQLFHSQVKVWMTIYDAGDCFLWRAFGKLLSLKGIREIAFFEGHLGNCFLWRAFGKGWSWMTLKIRIGKQSSWQYAKLFWRSPGWKEGSFGSFQLLVQQTFISALPLAVWFLFYVFTRSVTVLRWRDVTKEMIQ